MYITCELPGVGADVVDGGETMDDSSGVGERVGERVGAGVNERVGEGLIDLEGVGEGVETDSCQCAYSIISHATGRG